MRNDGKTSGISPGSRRNPSKSDGKRRPSTSPAEHRKPSKYTIVRTQQDIDQLEKLRGILKDVYGQGRYNTDSEIYRELPRLYLDAVKQSNDHATRCDVLTAELDQLEDLRTSFCRCMELSKERK